MTGTLDMVAPTITFVNNHEGGYWEVTYAGMVRRHRQDWQAFTFYEMARAAYSVISAAAELPNCCRPEPAADHDPTQQ